MRKRLITEEARPRADARDARWLVLEDVANVEISSEDAAHPIEAALSPEVEGVGSGSGAGWRADAPGRQTIRLRFDRPHKITRIFLRIEEHERARTQELAVRWSADGGIQFRDVVRQQFTFSPPGTTREEEDYRVQLDGVTALDLVITPDISGGEARASLAVLRLSG